MGPGTVLHVRNAVGKGLARTPGVYRNLTLTTILLKNGSLSSVEPLCLEEALKAGTLRASEVSAEGHVPELRARNSGDTPVLILDGEGASLFSGFD